MEENEIREEEEEENIPFEEKEEETKPTKKSVRIANREQKTQTVLEWIRNGLSDDDIRAELSVWMDNKKAIEELISLAHEENDKPRPIEERVTLIEEMIVGINERIEGIEEGLGEMKDLVSQLYGLMKGGKK